MIKANSKSKKLIYSNILLFLVYLVVNTALSTYIYSKVHSILFNVLFFSLTIIILHIDKSGLREHMYPFRVVNKKYVNLNYDDRVTYLYTTLGYYAMLISMFIPITRIVSSGLMVLFPCLAIVRYFIKKTICFGSPNKSRFSATANFIFFSGIIMTVFSIYNQQYTSEFWKLVTIVSTFWIVLFFIFSKEYLKKWTVVLGFAFCVSMFSFGAISTINRDYDFSQPQTYKVTVLDKQVSGGKSQILTVTVSPWETGQGDTNIEVGPDTYKNVTIGSVGYIIQHKGALNIPWYYFQEELRTEGGDPNLSYDAETVHVIYGGVSQNAVCFLIKVNGIPIGECWL